MPDPWGGDRPEADKVEALAKHLRDVWSQTREKMRLVDAYKGGTFSVWRDALDKRPAYHPPTARYLIDHAVDTQMSVDPKVKKFPAGEGDEHKKKADAVEPALTAVMLDAALKEPSIPWRQAYSHMLAYGYSVMGTEWEEVGGLVAPKRLDGEEEKAYEARMEQYEAGRVGWNPVRIKAPHPSRVLMNPNEMQPDLAIVESHRYAQDLANLVKRKGRYGSKRVKPYEPGDNPYKPVPLVEVFTAQWHGLKVKEDGDFLVVERSPWGFMPWMHGFAGWGGEVTEVESEGFDPKHMAVSMLEGIIGPGALLQVQAQKASSIHNAVLERGYARLGTSLPSEEAAQQLEAGPEAVLQGTREDWWWLEYPEIRDWVFKSQQNDDREIELATYIRQVVGEHQAGVTTLGQTMIYDQSASRKFYVPAKQIERMAGIIGRNILKMVDIRGEPITLQGHKLRPSDIEGSYDVSVLFVQVNPVTQMEMRKLGMQEVGAGLKSPETYRESDAMMENEAEESKRLMKARIRERDDVQEQLQINTIREEGLVQLADRLQEALDARIKGTGPVQAAPVAGNGAAPAEMVPPVQTGGR